jgi:hypothetical protein
MLIYLGKLSLIGCMMIGRENRLYGEDFKQGDVWQMKNVYIVDVR